GRGRARPRSDRGAEEADPEVTPPAAKAEVIFGHLGIAGAKSKSIYDHPRRLGGCAFGKGNAST
ncbi:MAG TPA: hypothetical protein VIT91_21535, partial [Chthoniobacterales bacterium]